ncbi:hypothetical protein B0T22DRAFT_504341 [Podospora appendiculata]|uniref:CCHC-type domain-containing protein n=1 Tax=Podospora appendiculata TaxID=314037 RepID=A0AAE0XHE2_9PEZI|nr:hypothetical protein B0T22DRAFT_504341 [Podospora appendiculata]
MDELAQLPVIWEDVQHITLHESNRESRFTLDNNSHDDMSTSYGVFMAAWILRLSQGSIFGMARLTTSTTATTPTQTSTPGPSNPRDQSLARQSNSTDNQSRCQSPESTNDEVVSPIPEPPPLDTHFYSRRGLCGNCHEPGHSVRDCVKQSPLGDIAACSFCNHDDHIGSDCPYKGWWWEGACGDNPWACDKWSPQTARNFSTSELTMVSPAIMLDSKGYLKKRVRNIHLEFVYDEKDLHIIVTRLRDRDP